MADNEDPKDKAVPELASKPSTPAGQAPVVPAKLKDPTISEAKPPLVSTFEAAGKAGKAPLADAAPAKFNEVAKAAAKPVVKAPAAKPPVPVAPLGKAAAVVAAPLPVVKAPAETAPVKAPIAKAKPGPKPKVKELVPSKTLSTAKPIEKVVPAKVAPTKPVIKVAKDVKSAVAPLTVPKAATPNAAPKTAPTKPVFAGLFTNFTLEEKTMDMSTNFAGLQDAMAEAQAKAKAAFEKSTSVFGDVSEFAKGNVEAVVASGKILAEGAQGMGSELVAEGRTAFETLTGDIKELAAAKSPTDFFKIQGDMVRKNFDSAVAYSSKNSEAMLKLFSDSFAPISGRMSIAMEKARSVSI